MGEGRDFGVGGYINRPLEAAVSIITDGIVMSIDANGDLILCTNTAEPYGIASRSTQNKVARTAGITSFDTGAQRDGGVPIMKSGIVELQLGSTNLAIKVGDRIVCHADDDGTVNGAIAIAAIADILLTVGYAESVVGVDVGGKVLVNLRLELGGAP